MSLNAQHVTVPTCPVARTRIAREILAKAESRPVPALTLAEAHLLYEVKVIENPPVRWSRLNLYTLRKERS